MKAMITAIMLLALSISVSAPEPFEGQTLISPLSSNNSFLIDMDGNSTKVWHGNGTPAAIAYLLPDSSVLRPCRDPGGAFSGGGIGGRIQRIDTDNNIVWDFFFSNANHQQHHDIEPLPNGNILLIAWERMTQAEATAAGRVAINGEMWPTLIAEVEPDGTTGGNIVWEWRAWDHLIQDADPAKDNYGVIADHPELIDINLGNVNNGDWIHSNSLDYNPDLDQIVFTSNSLDEFYIIDHSTTTEEASGHTGGNSGMGGDILYRWGNPWNYDRGTSADRVYYNVHGVNWIDPGLPGEGNILTLNNGNRPGGANDYSSVLEIITPIETDGSYTIEADLPFGPDAPQWSYQNPGVFYTDHIGGTYRLPNGNTLICEGTAGYIFEVTESGTTVWDYDSPVAVHRAPRYWDPASSGVDSNSNTAAGSIRLMGTHPNPFNPQTTLVFELSQDRQVLVEVFDAQGRRVRNLLNEQLTAGSHRLRWNGCDANGIELPAGLYLSRVSSEGVFCGSKMLLVR